MWFLKQASCHLNHCFACVVFCFSGVWLSKGPADTLELLGGVDGSLGRGRGQSQVPLSGPY